MTAKIFHADLYGTRPSKYAALASSDIASIAWQELAPNLPYYLFMPQEQAYREEYEQGWSATEVFPVNVLGFQTHRDQLAIDFDEVGLKKRIASFAKGEQQENELREEFGLGTWDIAKAQNKLRVSDAWADTVTHCLYRPFDVRAWCSSSSVTDRPRSEIIKNLVGKKNLALNITRQTRADEWRHAVVSDLPTPAVFVEVKDGSYVFPLWLYPTEQEKTFGMERRANLAPAFMAELAGRVGEMPTPEDVFHYAYAVFHAPTYRTRYAAFLKTDFPRLPLPPDGDTFRALAALGAKLTALHLLEAPELNRHGIGFPVGGDHVVQKMRRDDRYVPPAIPSPPELGAGGPTGGRVRLNGTEYFDNVPPEAWNFQVGGYQPAFKWLDDRNGRTLTEEDITHYRRMLAAMRDTAALLPPVDAAFLRMLNFDAVDDGNDTGDTPC